jgi:hypothetical protein
MDHDGIQGPIMQIVLLGVRGFQHLRSNSTTASVMNTGTREAKMAQLRVSETREKRR